MSEEKRAPRAKGTGKRAKKEQKEDMGKLLFAALDELEETEGLPFSEAKRMIEMALLASFNAEISVPRSIKLKDTIALSDASNGTHIVLDKENRKISMFRRRVVVEEVDNMLEQISLEEARRISVKYELGDVVEEPISMEFGFKASHAGKQNLIQSLGEWRKRKSENATAEKAGDMISVVVSSVDADGADLESDSGKIRLVKEEMIPGEVLRPGDKTRVYILSDKEAKGQTYRISRKHAGLVRSLFTLNIPEISEGLILIKDVAREAGSRTKISVVGCEGYDGDAVGACIGERGSRIAPIVEALNGEKIDVVPFSEHPVKYIASALAPAKVREVEYDGEYSATAWVDSDQLTLAIGTGGQNVRLAAHLTGCKIDIKGQQKPVAADTDGDAQ